jgi:hypothetical protein
VISNVQIDFFSILLCKKDLEQMNALKLAGYLIAPLLLAAEAASAQTPSIPQTPAGQVLSAFLDAFNSQDKAKLEAYIHTYDPGETVDDLASFGAETGGFTLVSIEHSDPASITFRARHKFDGKALLGNFLLASTAPPKVDSWTVRMIPPGATIDVTPLDAAARQRTIDAISAKLTEFYVYPDVAQRMVQALRDHSQHGDYDTLTDGYAFAAALLRDLRAVNNDKHLRVVYDALNRPGPPPANDKPQRPSPDEIAAHRARLEHDNCMFSKVEILPRNTGYLKFDGFMDPEICGAVATAALNFLAHTDAVIIDLRTNGGGDPAMVQYVASYFFDEATHINDLYNRHDDERKQYWTLPYVTGPRIQAPLYILTSSRTFSGAEEFTYDMQTQKRATIVGETTGGGAHPVRGMPAGDHFTIGVPFARPINPVTKKDWEGTGIKPDVPVPAADALATAQKLAAERKP